MKDYRENGKIIEIILENGQVVKVASAWVFNTMKKLDTDMEDVLLMYLEDNDYLQNDEQDELDKKAKENKSNKIIDTKDKGKERKKREVVKKENPTKEKVISIIANILPEVATDIVIENKTKIITFKIGEEDFKIDLIQKRNGKKGE